MPCVDTCSNLANLVRIARGPRKSPRDPRRSPRKYRKDRFRNTLQSMEVLPIYILKMILLIKIIFRLILFGNIIIIIITFYIRVYCHDHISLCI
jgi:hypothetical protein